MQMDLVQEDIQLSSKLTTSLKRITETLIFTPQVRVHISIPWSPSTTDKKLRPVQSVTDSSANMLFNKEMKCGLLVYVQVQWGVKVPVSVNSYPHRSLCR